MVLSDINYISKIYYKGFFDSLDLYSIGEKILKNEKLIMIFKKIIIINLVYLNLFVIVLKYIVPLIICKLYSKINLEIYNMLVLFFCFMPIMLLSILNSLSYYNKITDIFCEKLLINRSSITYRVSNLFFFQVLFITLNVIIFLITFIPYFGIIIGNFLFVLLNSFYVYDYRCYVYDINYENRKNYFQKNWIYFLGFGTPFLIIKLLLGNELSFITNSTLMAVLIVKSIYIDYPKVIQKGYYFKFLDRLMILTDYIFKCFVLPNLSIN